MDLHKAKVPEIDQLLKDEWLFEYKGFLFPTNDFEKPEMNKFDKLERIKNLKSTENGIVVVGIPKAGSHLCMGILDALGLAMLDYLWNNYFVVIF